MYSENRNHKIQSDIFILAKMGKFALHILATGPEPYP